MSGVSKGGTSRRRRTWTKLCSKRNLAMQAKFKNMSCFTPRLIHCGFGVWSRSELLSFVLQNDFECSHLHMK